MQAHGSDTDQPFLSLGRYFSVMPLLIVSPAPELSCAPTKAQSKTDLEARPHSCAAPRPNQANEAIESAEETKILTE
jgi:hypothetical protein